MDDEDEDSAPLTGLIASKMGAAVAREFHRPKSMRRPEVVALGDGKERTFLMLVSIRAGASVNPFPRDAGGGCGVEIHIDAAEVEERHVQRVDIREAVRTHGCHELRRYGLRDTWSQYVEES